MSRSTTTHGHAAPMPVSRPIRLAEIDAALDEARRLRAEAFAAWLGRVAHATNNLVTRGAALLHRHRIAG